MKDSEIKKKVEELTIEMSLELSHEVVLLLLNHGLKGKELSEELEEISQKEDESPITIGPPTISHIKNDTSMVSHLLRKKIIYFSILLAKKRDLYKSSGMQKEVESRFEAVHQHNDQDKIERALGTMLGQSYYMYFYDYKRISDEKNVLRRQVLKIQKGLNGRYMVTLEKIAQYGKYEGEIKYLTERMVGLYLEGGGKRQIIFFSIPEGEIKKLQSFYFGIYLKHNLDGQLFSGNIIIKNVGKEKKLKPQDINYEEVEIKEVDKLVRDYFRQGSKNFLNPPIEFDKQRLENVLKLESVYKEYDIFVAYPYLALERKINEIKKIREEFLSFLKSSKLDGENLKNKIITTLQLHKLDEENYLKDHARIAELENRINEIFDDNQKKVDNVKNIVEYNSDTFKQKVQELISNFKTYQTIDGRQLKIFDSRQEVESNAPRVTTSDGTIKEDWKNLRKSKSLLLICPYSNMFSSCWVELGWAMALNIPVFIVYLKDDNLPFILQQMSNIFRFYLYRIDSIKDIPIVHRGIMKEHKSKLN